MTDIEQDKRLIEVEMPLEKISEESRREKNIRKGNPSTMHLWWARRPLSASRAASYASLVEDPGNSQEREEMSEFVKQLSTWEATKDENILERASGDISELFEGETPRLLDPFSGGGALPLEGLRVGCESHAIDLNPVAHIINKATMEYPNAFHGSSGSSEKDTLMVDDRNDENPLIEDIEEWASWTLEEVKTEIGDLFADNSVGYLWARTLPCQNPECDLDIPLIRNRWLDRTQEIVLHYEGSRDGGLEVDIYERDDLIKSNDGNKIKFEVKGSDKEVIPAEGTIQRGSVSCPACNSSFKSERTRELSNKTGFGKRLMTVIEIEDNKKYRLPSEDDLEAFEKAEQKLKELDDKWIPDEPLPPSGALGIRVNNYEYESWGDLFNPRQKLILGTFCKKVDEVFETVSEKESEEYARAISTYLSFSIDKMANRNSKLSIWKHERVMPTLGGFNALPIEWDYVETNPFSGWTGSWHYSLKYITDAIETCQYTTGYPEANIGDATRLPYPENHFDAVLTDPPYYDNVPYSHLSDFFYIWMKRSIGDAYPELFTTPLTPKSKEIIEEPNRHDSESEAEEFFEETLSDAFSEIQRVLKTDGICTIVFAHKSTEAWAQMIRSLLSSGLVVTATWPIHTERHSRPRSLESASLSSSIYFVCRERSDKEVGYYSDVSEQLEEKVHERLDYFWDQGIRGADLLVSAIGPAVSVFGQYREVKRLSGESVTVDELLEETQRLVSDYALGKVLEGDIDLGSIDPETRFYILYRWAFANQKEDYDEVRKLAQVNKADTDRLERLGIIDVSRGDALLVPPQNRNLSNPDEIPEGNNLPLVDKIQRASILWENGQRELLKSFVEEHCMSEEFWRSAQAISECLPEEESKSQKEKQMLHGLLGYGGQTEFEASGQSSLGKYTDGGEDQ